MTLRLTTTMAACVCVPQVFDLLGNKQKLRVMEDGRQRVQVVRESRWSDCRRSPSAAWTT